VLGVENDRVLIEVDLAGRPSGLSGVLGVLTGRGFSGAKNLANYGYEAEEKIESADSGCR
jgi:hypothetical protein